MVPALDEVACGLVSKKCNQREQGPCACILGEGLGCVGW